MLTRLLRMGTLPASPAFAVRVTAR
jgi:hypothetical protein